MRFLARGILVVVAIFVVVVTTTLVLKTKSAKIEPLSGPPTSPADLQIKQVDLEEEAQGVRWRLKAEQALMYDEAGITKMKKPVARIFQKNRAWTVVGEEGDLDGKTNNVEVRRNVVVTSDDGLQLETSVLHWDAERRRLWTDVPVLLSREGSTVSGSGLSVLLDDESTTVSGPVRATFLVSKKR